MITLGLTYRDRYLGVTGIAAAREEHLDGSPTVLLQWMVDDGMRSSWTEEGRLDLVEARTPGF